MDFKQAELTARNNSFTLTSWTAQSAWNPPSMSEARGVFFWDPDDKRFLDWSSQLFNVNVGHGYPHIFKAIREQATRIGHAYTDSAIKPRACLGDLLREIAPAGLTRRPLTIGRASAIENAKK